MAGVNADSSPDATHGSAAVVFGAAGGIGRATVKALRQTGSYGQIVGVDLGRALTDTEIVVDIADTGQREEVIDRLLGWPTRIGALVYSIGINAAVRADRGSWPVWQKIMEVDLIAPSHLLSGLHERIVKDGTAVVVVDSVAADVGSSASPPYAAAKGGCRALTRSLALRTGTSAARYNSVAPGPIATGMGEKLAAELGTTQQSFGDRTIAKRLGSPAEVAAVIAFLCGPGASFINGTVVVVDGGYLAG